jgi:hypothetical protein
VLNTTVSFLTTVELHHTHMELMQFQPYMLTPPSQNELENKHLDGVDDLATTHPLSPKPVPTPPGWSLISD